ncbi:MAG: hypothetical protein ACRDZQ_04640 [Acidimicrobiales bacterium]
MDEEELARRARELRTAGCSPKEISRALGARPATVAMLIRAMAAERPAAPPCEPRLVGCWVSTGWSEGLGIRGHPEWPGLGASKSAHTGLVGVLVAREHRGGPKVSACGYLVDAYCLGVKDALGPRVMRRDDLPAFVRLYFDAFDEPPLAAPIELAGELVFGAVDYARSLGFEPAPDLRAAIGHLGSPPRTSSIRFGRNGKPFFVQGPYDDGARIWRTLEAKVGIDNFHFLMPLESLPDREGALAGAPGRHR